MPSTDLPPSPPLLHHHHHTNHLYPFLAAAVSFSLLLLFSFLYRKLTLSRTSPAPLSPPNNHELRRFHFSTLKKATSSFSPSNKLGQGGFGSVYRAVIPTTGEVFAVKVMDSAAGSIQGEREFHNEISLASRVRASEGSMYLVAVVGHATAERRRKEEERKAIVYEFMSNGSLQEKLLDGKCRELAVWERRMKIMIDVAKGLKFLHFDCGETAVVHGDLKPSNVLLDDEFNAKVGDFGLVRVLDPVEAEKSPDCNDKVEEDVEIGSIVEEESSVVTVECSPVTEVGASVSVSPSEGFERASSLPESWNDKMSVESGKKKGGGGGGGGWGSGRDYWWWKQGEESSGRVKDYVMEWIGSEIKKERPKSSDLGVVCGGNSIACNDVVVNVDDGDCRKKIEEEKKHKKKKKRLDWWWMSLDYDEFRLRKKRDKNGRKPREWWKEEFCEELTKKNKKSKSNVGSEMWWQRDEDFVAPERKKRRKSKSSFGSIDWWLDGLSGELRSGGGGGCHRNSQDWGNSMDIPKSGGISSTPSMRGTMCYIAPECGGGGGGQLSEKCDVYSFGVLVLVIISGRRPLQVLASPMSEFERANLVSWARQLAYNGRLLDLVDTTIQSLDRDQAMLCITIALLCLQRSPSKRPNMKEIVEMLSGEAEPPHLPFEFSPSPPSNFPFKSRKKGW